ncbi:hypothetical protein CONCODRAFT_3086 [Conidiobolus coronatus NRRL 28638]|uniref:Rad51-like C-terminal domain-containing protein n=1 Tax=Conidiobolus coronatus (strain ATCC 28846 / CBS 209.66 / NRRL 28638) TaxID=796925 RepID=A0A137PFS7_CONC2|nr:hypothetical protein CONCODRAFT_3086 [Conidiobolus coronatus NRRL 28638]|eukprot:KXN73848.1 hypothetical protein CONCODRAFT_3086 [Conidiobolus coronatus NRRL 28638]
MKSLKQKLTENLQLPHTSIDLLPISSLFPAEGIAAGSIIELLGASHSGKSYLSYMLAINTIIQSKFKSKVIYIDTKNYFDPRQCTNLSHELLDKLNMDNSSTFDKILTNLILIKPGNWKEYINLIVGSLPQYLKENPQVELVIIDEFLQLNKLAEGQISDNLRIQLMPQISQSILNLVKLNSKLSIITCSKILLPQFNSQIDKFNFNRIINTNTGN